MTINEPKCDQTLWYTDGRSLPSHESRCELPRGHRGGHSGGNSFWTAPPMTLTVTATAGKDADPASYGAPMRMPMGVTCAVHRHREWVPIERHHIWPLGMGGPDVAANIVSVCANGHYAIHEYIRQLIMHAGQVPAATLIHFGDKVRKYALQGWTEAGKPTHGGGGE